MKPRVELSKAAETALEEHLLYVAARNLVAAVEIARDVRSLLGRLARREFEGSEVTLSDGRTARRWPVGSLVVYYRRRASVLFVVRIYHHARRPIER